MSRDSITPTQHTRPPQDNIPPTKQMRDRLLEIVGRYVQSEKPVVPLSIDELRQHAQKVVTTAKISSQFIDFTAILINNEAWRPTVAGVPYQKRLLLLPKCFRDKKNCQAEMDEFGLICDHCGRCAISDLQKQAEELGYAVLVAEGSPVVMSLIATGKVQAVIGVSCLSLLQEVFPYMEAGAIPGIAIPLLQGGCEDTSADIDWVLEAIYENGEEKSPGLNLPRLRRQVENWFSHQSLQTFLGPMKYQTEELALKWLADNGKRWRPFLAVCAFQALKPGDEDDFPQDIVNLAVAVECFHKASLVHDDIEDGDLTRYGQKSLHAEHGVPVALNVGDYLLGLGYSLLGQLKAPPQRIAKIMRVAARGHCDLCLGQGNELSWRHNPSPLTIPEVIDIFRMKTAPAFEVALKLGALWADADEDIINVLQNYSRALGIAYQINDDIVDFLSPGEQGDFNAMRLSLLPALAYKIARGDDKKLLESLWNQSENYDNAMPRVKSVFAQLNIEHTAMNLLESYKSQAISSLTPLSNSNLKALLRRVVGMIFNDFDVMACCDDYKAGHSQGDQPG